MEFSRSDLDRIEAIYKYVDDVPQGSDVNQLLEALQPLFQFARQIITQQEKHIGGGLLSAADLFSNDRIEMDGKTTADQILRVELFDTGESVLDENGQIRDEWDTPGVTTIPR